MSLLEVKHGLLQISETLNFLHNNAHLIHRAISPEVNFRKFISVLVLLEVVFLCFLNLWSCNFPAECSYHFSWFLEACWVWVCYFDSTGWEFG